MLYIVLQLNLKGNKNKFDMYILSYISQILSKRFQRAI